MQVRSEVRGQGPGAGAGGHTGRETHHVGGRRRQGGHCGEEAMSAVEGPPRAPLPRCCPLGGQPSSRPTPHCPARLRDPWSLPGVTSHSQSLVKVRGFRGWGGPARAEAACSSGSKPREAHRPCHLRPRKHGLLQVGLPRLPR